MESGAPERVAKTILYLTIKPLPWVQAFRIIQYAVFRDTDHTSAADVRLHVHC
jgi:hypothetical protein